MALSKLPYCARAALAIFGGWLALLLLAASTAAGGTARDSQADLASLEPARAAHLRQLIADPAAACMPAAAALGSRDGAQAAIVDAVRPLQVSPVGSWLLEQAVAQGVLICLDPATRLAAWYRSQLRVIGVQAALPPAAKTLFLAHELAHVPQHPSYSNSLTFPVDDLILMHRLREASAEAIATRALWQMKRRGRPAAWQAKLETGYGNIGRAFAAAMAAAAGERDADGGGNELAATRAAFDQWFAWDLRLEQYDDHMLDHVERVARAGQGWAVPPHRLTERFMLGIGQHAGQNFLSAGALPEPLTGERYRRGLTSANAVRLADLLEAGGGTLAGAAAALPAVLAAPSDAD